MNGLPTMCAATGIRLSLAAVNVANATKLAIMAHSFRRPEDFR